MFFIKRSTSLLSYILNHVRKTPHLFFSSVLFPLLYVPAHKHFFEAASTCLSIRHSFSQWIRRFTNEAHLNNHVDDASRFLCLILHAKLAAKSCKRPRSPLVMLPIGIFVFLINHEATTLLLHGSSVALPTQ